MMEINKEGAIIHISNSSSNSVSSCLWLNTRITSMVKIEWLN